MRQTDFVESVFMETSAEQVDAVLYQAMFDETVRLRRCTNPDGTGQHTEISYGILSSI